MMTATVDMAAAERFSIAELQQVLRQARSRRASDPASRQAVGWPSGCVAILAAHAGAGASTVALAIADTASDAGRAVHLVDWFPTARSGLASAATSELGVGADPVWRRGSRDHVTIDRFIGEVPRSWPSGPAGECLELVDAPASGTTMGVPTIVVCRATVPGVRHAESLLSSVTAIAVAVVGPRRWPGAVEATVGHRLEAVRAAGRVVPVPLDRRVEVSGPCAEPLPKQIRASARALLALIDDATRTATPDRS